MMNGSAGVESSRNFSSVSDDVFGDPLPYIIALVGSSSGTYRMISISFSPIIDA